MSYVEPRWLQSAVAEYGRECKEQLEGGISEPEAAIRSPIEKLLGVVAAQSNRKIVTHGEAPLVESGVRPDYALRIDGVVTGYLEVKRPNLDLDPSTFRGNNKRQWEQLRDVPDLIYTNGNEWRLYRHGELLLLASLSGNLRTTGNSLRIADDAFERLALSFLEWKPRKIASVSQLVTDVAPLCRLLRSSVRDQLIAEGKAIKAGADEWDQPFTALAKDWRNLLFPTASDDTFADGYAQTITFALLLARTENIDFSRANSMHEIARRLGASQSHALMSKALQLLADSASAQIQFTLDLLIRVIGVVDWNSIRDITSDSYLHLYESFLEVYDPKLREDSGIYYTPYQVVDAMVRLADDVLRTRLNTPNGFLDEAVTTVDPAMGTGTFLNSIIERVAGQAAQTDGPGALPMVIAELAKRLIGFELLMGSYAVAEMRMADLLKSYGAEAPAGGMRLYVTNALDDPYVEQTQIAATYAPLARSHRQANQVKANTPVTVVIGNPPYDERANGRGGWVENGGHGTTAPLERFRKEGNGKYEYVLRSFYVYFYAWATWKVFDASPEDRHGIVTFITTSGYLSGLGFKGMREYLRTTCSEGWIINASPEGLQPDVPTRFFPGVQQPLAIGIFVRHKNTNPSIPAVIHYAEVSGRREAKYEQLAALTLDDHNWRAVRSGWDAPFTPAINSIWDDYPALDDLMPWSVKGVKPNRTWVYSPSRDVLHERWGILTAEGDPDRKRKLFKESRDRTIDSKVGPLPGRPRTTSTIAAESGASPTPERVSFRSFDRQWVIPDNRLFHGPSPDLWRASAVPGQLFMLEQHSQPIESGPGVMFTTLIPDIHSFNGRGGRVFPMMHPDASANFSPSLLTRLGQRLGIEVTEQLLLAYVAAVVAHQGFTQSFADELMTPGIRVPVTADPDLFSEAARLGEEVVWAVTYGAAFSDPANGRALNVIAFPDGDERRVQNLSPIRDKLPSSITYEADSQQILIGGGSFGPVPVRVWEYDVGGMKVIKHWFDYRKARPAGKKTSPLDDIHVKEWPLEWVRELNELLTALRRLTDREAYQADLLYRVLSGPVITQSELVSEGVTFPATPKDRLPRYLYQDTLL
jgi:hypothetical protein